MLIFDMIINTPPYVWFILGCLIFLGIQAMKPQIIYFPFFLTAPIAINALRYSFFLNASNTQLLFYIFTAIIGISIGLCVASNISIKKISKEAAIQLPGNKHSLIFFLLYFCIQYFFGVIKTVNPSSFEQFALFETTTRALFTGFLLGKSIFYTYFYFKNRRS